MNKSGPSECNYMACVRHFSLCSFMSDSCSAAAQHISVGLGSSFLNRNPECLGTLRQRFYGSSYASALWTLSKHLHFRHTYRKALVRDASATVQANCELLPQLSFSGTQKDWIQIPSRGCHWLSRKGLTSLVSWNLAADRRLKREDKLWSLHISIKI